MDKNENIVQTRGRHTSEWGKNWVSSDAKKGKKAWNMIFLNKLLRSVFFKAESQQLEINN